MGSAIRGRAAPAPAPPCCVVLNGGGLQGPRPRSPRVDDPITGEALRREQLAFAQRAFVNAQELIRFMDQKAAFILATVGVVTSALAALTVTVLRQNADAPLYLLATTAFLGLCYVLVSVIVIWTATVVFAAKSNTLRPASSAPGLLFPLIVLKKHARDESRYFEALRASSSGDLLAEYSNQIMELSNIYSDKQQRINLTLTLFQTLIVLWIVELLLLGILSVF